MKTERINHTRTVVGLYTWLGSIGGVQAIIIQMLSFLFLPYLQFNYAVESLPLFDAYVSLQEQKEEEEIMQMKTFARIQLWLFVNFKCLEKFVGKANLPKMKRQKERIKVGFKELKNDMNYLNLVLKFKEDKHVIKIKQIESILGNDIVDMMTEVRPVKQFNMAKDHEAILKN